MAPVEYETIIKPAADRQSHKSLGTKLRTVQDRVRRDRVVDWYNTTRLYGEIGHIPPLEYEAQWHAAHNPAKIATTNQP